MGSGSRPPPRGAPWEMPVVRSHFLGGAVTRAARIPWESNSVEKDLRAARRRLQWSRMLYQMLRGKEMEMGHSNQRALAGVGKSESTGEGDHLASSTVVAPERTVADGATITDVYVCASS